MAFMTFTFKLMVLLSYTKTQHYKAKVKFGGINSIDSIIQSNTQGKFNSLLDGQ